MTVPTPPAVSDAMREAVARWLQSWWPLSDRTALAHADDLLALGPIASEIARLTGERDAARREVEGYDKSHALQRQRWREDEQFKRLDRIRQQIAGLRPGDAEVISDAQSRIHAAEARAEAAEAETARLRAALRLAENPLSYRHATDPNGPGSIAVARALEAVRAALTSQEKTDV